jgi:hypothetical protein
MASGASHSSNTRGRGCVLWTIVGLLAATAGFHRSCGPFYYSSPPIRARVIDEPTGRPVEGAVVVAVWMLDSAWYGDRPLHASEVLTDQNGQFEIPAMRKPRPWLMFFDFRDPEILIYKPGWRVKGLNNYELYVRPITRVGQHVRTTTLADGRIMAEPAVYSTASQRACYWNGKIISMTPNPGGDSKSVVNAYDSLSSYAISWLPPNDFPLLWKQLQVGYDQLSPTARKTPFLMNPRTFIPYWKDHQP